MSGGSAGPGTNDATPMVLHPRPTARSSPRAPSLRPSRRGRKNRSSPPVGPRITERALDDEHAGLPAAASVKACAVVVRDRVRRRLGLAGRRRRRSERFEDRLEAMDAGVVGATSTSSTCRPGARRRCPPLGRDGDDSPVPAGVDVELAAFVEQAERPRDGPGRPEHGPERHARANAGVARAASRKPRRRASSDSIYTSLPASDSIGSIGPAERRGPRCASGGPRPPGPRRPSSGCRRDQQHAGAAPIGDHAREHQRAGGDVRSPRSARASAGRRGQADRRATTAAGQASKAMTPTTSSGRRAAEAPAAAEASMNCSHARPASAPGSSVPKRTDPETSATTTNAMRSGSRRSVAPGEQCRDDAHLLRGRSPPTIAGATTSSQPAQAKKPAMTSAAQADQGQSCSSNLRDTAAFSHDRPTPAGRQDQGSSTVRPRATAFGPR